MCVFEFASRQTASGMPVGGSGSGPDTSCLYYSVYYWQCATQLSFDLWIGMVCIYTPNKWLLNAKLEALCVCVCVCIFIRYVCVFVQVPTPQRNCIFYYSYSLWENELKLLQLINLSPIRCFYTPRLLISHLTWLLALNSAASWPIYFSFFTDFVLALKCKYWREQTHWAVKRYSGFCRASAMCLVSVSSYLFVCTYVLFTRRTFVFLYMCAQPSSDEECLGLLEDFLFPSARPSFLGRLSH